MPIQRLAEIAYYQTGGTCSRLYLPKSTSEIQDAVREIHSLSQPFFVLGGGTNSLVCDDNWSGAVIALTHMDGLSALDENGRIFCEAGVENSKFALFAVDHGLTDGIDGFELHPHADATITPDDATRGKLSCAAC